VWKIASIPNGLYQDETAIGYNASLIADTGFDEHQHFLPVYFESFSDYKAPIYIYAVAGFFKLFDPSIFLLRFTSVFFFLLTLIGCVCVVSMLTEKPDRRVLLYTLLAVGFLPWFFTLSRISFEVISQTTFTVWSLWFLQKIYTDPRDRFASIMAAVGGILMGITLYTYPTARVLTPLFVLFTLCIFARRSSWKRTLTMLGGFVIAMIPYAVYSLQNPGAMTSRFKGITYVFDPTASLLQKIHTFVGNYVQYFSPNFLLIHGDANMRHATGLGGEISLAVLLLALTGIIWSIVDRTLWKQRMFLLLFLCTVTAPFAAALTSDGTPHSLRSILLGLFVVLWSCIGFLKLTTLRTFSLRSILIISTFLLLIGESTLYLQNYFTTYAAHSGSAFESEGMQDAIQEAVAFDPNMIIVSTSINYATADFYKRLYVPDSVQLLISNPTPLPGACIIYLPSDQAAINASPLQYAIPTKTSDWTQVRCYR
jgi:hypothetical protein